MRRVTILALLTLVWILPGCVGLSVRGRTVNQTAPAGTDASHVSDVWGYGSGRTEVAANKAAWDDAIARMKAMGFAEGQHTIKATPELKLIVGEQVDGHRYKASVHLEISK